MSPHPRSRHRQKPPGPRGGARAVALTAVLGLSTTLLATAGLSTPRAEAAQTAAAQVFHEAEEGTRSGGAATNTDHAGHSGTGFVDNMGSRGATLRTTVRADQARPYDLGIRYANGPHPFAGAKTLSLSVNGRFVQQLSMPTTQDWDTWAMAHVTAPLQAGENTVELSVGEHDTGSVNIDLLAVRPAGERIHLLDGSGATDAWQHNDGSAPRWPVADGVMTVKDGDLRTKEAFGDHKLHVEFNIPKLPDDVTGQDRGNSGVYLQERYEIQVLDAYGLPRLSAHDAAAVYAQKAPDANAAREPGTWQTYDITYRAATYDRDGNKTANARASVWWNGTLVHDDVEITGGTGGNIPEGPSTGSLRLQDHGNPVQYRDIWIEPLHDADEVTCDGRDPGISDEFTGDRLDGCRWDRPVRQRAQDLDVADGALTLRTGYGEIYGPDDFGPSGPGDGPGNLVLQTAPSGDWTVETRMEETFSEKYQQGGLLAYLDDDTYVKLDVLTVNEPGQPVRQELELRSEVGSVVQEPRPIVATDHTGPWWLRLTKTGTTFTGAWSTDGTHWTDFPAAVTNPDLDGQGIGVYTMGWRQQQAKTASFDYLRLTRASGKAPAKPALWTVTSPDKAVEANITLDEAGALSLAARTDGKPALGSAPVGVTASGQSFLSGLTFTKRTDRKVKGKYTTTTGAYRRHTVDAAESTLWFKNAQGQRLALDVHAANDGLAYRYRLPDARGASPVRETSGFRVPNGSAAWVLPYNAYYEQKWQQRRVGGFTGDHGLDALFELGDGRYAQISETSTYDGGYAGSHLAFDAADPTRARFALPADGATTSGPLTTPWRTAALGSLGEVVTSDLVKDLSPKSRVRDTSWIEPGRVAWSWWSDSGSPRDFGRQKEFVDHAASQGWEYVLVDEGWSADWVPELVRYASERGVRVLLWTHWNGLDTQEEREAQLPLWKKWGVAGVKIDFMESDSQARMEWYEQVLKRTAELRLMVNFHGSTAPRGIQRTWPHVLTMESVRGAEWYKFGDITPEHNTILPFTRNVNGSMDYTPVTFSANGRTTSDGHELGLGVVYESGWQHLADSPQAYGSRPLASAFLSALPTVWDESVLAGGRPGELATVARRSGEEWYVGSIAAGPARPVEVPLGFLGEGPYLAEVYADAAGGGLEKRTSVVERSGSLRVDVPADGGFAVRLCKGQDRVDARSCAGS
ncbi:glycoside hydrolase family 97 catalytic domain-containing protein [Streptomyces sp. NPDC007325]|uniref:glycoside hydrolase family 97 catalytic domain-containing protein n=1 Tax=Streptomyces sp. NPDC007325 TaxID=3154588 RepID=UPI0033CA5FC0